MGTIRLERLPYGARRIVNEADGRDILVQTDWDWPGIAGTFGWDVREVQVLATDARGRLGRPAPCEHDGTDGTITCGACGLEAADFITSAGEWMDEHDGATADDPGYFADL